MATWPAIVAGSGVLAILFGMHIAVVHATLVELFPTNVRYTAYSFGYNVTFAVFGGTAPLLMTFLIAKTGIVLLPAVYIAFAATVTLIAVSRIKESAGSRLRES